MSKGFRLVAADVPTRRGRGSTLYDDIISDFLNSKLESARLEETGRKPATLALQLRKSIKASKAKVAVVTRGGEVFLVREK